MNGIDIDPTVLSQVQANMLAQNVVHIAQLEAAVQQLAAEIRELQSLVPSDESVAVQG